MPTAELLSFETCKAKAVECRALSNQARDESYRIILLHMAETWERMAKTYEDEN